MVVGGIDAPVYTIQNLHLTNSHFPNRNGTV